MHKLGAYLLLVLILGGCAGGSGSSGFDVAAAERGAITTALQEQRCVPVKQTQLTICPADVSAPAGAPGGVETGLDQGRNIICATASSDGCAFQVPFMPEGLPPDAVFRVAIRSLEPTSAWRISVAPVRNPAPEAPDFDVPIVVAPPSATPAAATRVQIAILVYLHAPDSIPESVEHLSDSGADLAYIVEATLARPQ